MFLCTRENTFWLARAAPAPSVLQQLPYSISYLKASWTSQFSASRCNGHFVTVSLSWRKTVQLNKRKTKNSLFVRECLFSVLVLQRGWVCSRPRSTGVWGAEMPLCATRGRSPLGSGSRAADRAWEGNSPAAAKRHGPAQNTEKPPTALSRQRIGNIIVTGV